MKILFVYYDTGSSEPPRIGFGVAYLSAFLKKNGHETRLCYFRSSADVEHLISIAREWQPQLIAHSSTSSSFFSVRSVTKEVKAQFPKIYQVCGGNHISLCPDDFSKLPWIDAICIGYGEYPLLELAEALQKGADHLTIRNLYFRHNKTIIKNPQRSFASDLDLFIPCDRDIFRDELKRFSSKVDFGEVLGERVEEFMFCRGCPYDCTFCCNHAIKELGSGKYVTYPSVTKCIEELIQVKEKTGMTGVAFHDDIFTLNRKWFRNFTEQYKQRVGLPYICNLRAKCFNEEDVIFLKESGCKIAILGIESGNEYIRNTIMKKAISEEDITEAYKILHKHGIKTHSQNMIGLPDETPERFIDTIKINAKVMPNHASLSVFFPYPGTVLYDKCIQENLIDYRLNNHEFHERKDTILRLTDFPRETIIFYAKNFNNLIQYEYLSNKYNFLKKCLPLNKNNQKVIASLMSKLLIFFRLLRIHI